MCSGELEPLSYRLPSIGRSKKIGILGVRFRVVQFRNLVMLEFYLCRCKFQPSTLGFHPVEHITLSIRSCVCNDVIEAYL